MTFLLKFRSYVLLGLLILPAGAWADQASDVSRCISAAKRFANVDLPRAYLQYDGGFFSSEIKWVARTPNASCIVRGDTVTDLVVEGETFIINGFAGSDAAADYEAFEKLVDRINDQTETWKDELDRKLNILLGFYQRPITDREELRQSGMRMLDPIAVRVLGDQDDFIRYFFNSDESSESGNSDTPNDQKIPEMIAEILNLQQALNAAQSEIEAANQRIESLEFELSELRAPIDSELSILSEKIDALQFDEVASIIDKIENSPRMTNSIKEQIIIELATRVRQIPSSDLENNLKGYRLLYAISPDESRFQEKIEYYSTALSNLEIEAEQEKIAEWIKHSDDFGLYRNAMILAAKNLLDSDRCTSAQLEYYGGWVRSTVRSGHYFMDCDDNRFWLNPNDSSTATQQSPVNASRAQQICELAIEREVVGQPRFMILERSYRVNQLLATVTYSQGFSLNVGSGERQSFMANCTIAPDGSVDLLISNY